MSDPLQMPNTPLEGEAYQAENGVVYVWDGIKWNVGDDGVAGGYWVPDPDDTTLVPGLVNYGIKIVSEFGHTKELKINMDGIHIESLPEV